MSTFQPETMMLALRALDAAAAGVRTAELNERTQRRMDAAAQMLKVAELERNLSEAAAQNRALRERIAELERDVLSLRDHAASLTGELYKRELAIVDLVLKGIN